MGSTLRLLLLRDMIRIRGEVIGMVFHMVMLGAFLPPHHVCGIVDKHLSNHLILMSS